MQWGWAKPFLIHGAQINNCFTMQYLQRFVLYNFPVRYILDDSRESSNFLLIKEINCLLPMEKVKTPELWPPSVIFL